MKKEIRSLALTAATAWLAVGVAAAQAPPASGSSSAAKSITVTGCVQRAEKAATGTTGTAGASSAMADETKFVLKTPWQAPAPRGRTCRHGGHGVRGHTGGQRVSSRCRRGKAQPACRTQGGDHRHGREASWRCASSSASAPKLKVDNVKMVSATCP